MILQLSIKDVIALVDDGKVDHRNLLALDTVGVHRCGKDLKYDIDLGETAEQICDHFTGRVNTFPAVKKATGGHIPYAFMIGGNLGAPEFDGVIWQCTPLDDIARHAGRFHNKKAIGVAVIADPRVRPCSDKQTDSLIDLCVVLSMILKKEPECVKGHMELGKGASSNPNKVCPGPLLPMDVVRDDVLKARGDLALQIGMMAGLVL